MTDIAAFRAAPRRVLPRMGARHRHHPDRARTPAQPRQRLPLPLRQLFLLSHRLPRARGGAGADRRRRSRKSHPVLPREESRSAKSGTASATARRRRRRSFGFDEAYSIAAARREAARAAGQPARAATTRPACDPAWDARIMGWLNRRARAWRAPASPRRTEIRDVRALLDEMRLIKDAHETRHHAPRRGDLRRRARARHARHAPGPHANTKSKPSCCTNSAATARSSPPTGRSSPAAPTPACCTIATTTRALDERRPAADRRRLRTRRLRLRHHAHLPGERPLQRPAARRVRTGAGRAGRGHRAR